MSDSRFDILHKLRQRRADRVQQELVVRRAQEQEPRTEAIRAKDAMLAEIANRRHFAGKLSDCGVAPATAADQLAGRACLVRMDGQVVRATLVATVAADTLLRAVAVTAECAQRLRAAHVATERSRHSAERDRQWQQARRLAAEDAELDEETELQLMTRFTQVEH